jgi:hypothetical protein
VIERPLACVMCGFGLLTTVRPIVMGDQPVICGGCGGIQVLTVAEDDDAPMATLRRAGSVELRELLADPAVRRFRDAFDVETIERAGEGARKTKVKGKMRLRAGDGPTPLGRMTAHGPDYHGPPL